MFLTLPLVYLAAFSPAILSTLRTVLRFRPVSRSQARMPVDSHNKGNDFNGLFKRDAHFAQWIFRLSERGNSAYAASVTLDAVANAKPDHLGVITVVTRHLTLSRPRHKMCVYRKIRNFRSMASGCDAAGGVRSNRRRLCLDGKSVVIRQGRKYSVGVKSNLSCLAAHMANVQIYHVSRFSFGAHWSAPQRRCRYYLHDSTLSDGKFNFRRVIRYEPAFFRIRNLTF